VNLGAYGNTGGVAEPGGVHSGAEPERVGEVPGGPGTIVTWRSGGAGAMVDIYFSPDGGGTWSLLAANELNDGTGRGPGHRHRPGLLRIADSAVAAIVDGSNNTFVVGEAGRLLRDIAGTWTWWTTSTPPRPGTTPTAAPTPRTRWHRCGRCYGLRPPAATWCDGHGLVRLGASAEIGSADAGITIRGPVMPGHTATLDAITPPPMR